MTTEIPWGARLASAVSLCEAEFDRRNLLVSGPLAASSEAVRRLARDGRRVRLAVLGRRGAGKSSLLNALANEPRAPIGDVSDATGHPTWYPLARTRDVLDWIDMPGFRAGGRSSRRADVVEALAASQADGLLWVVQASEVDAGIDDDVRDLREALGALTLLRGDPPPLAVAVTKVDELDPPDVDRPPFDRDPTKARNIAAAVARITRIAHGVAGGLGFVLPVVTYLRFDGARITDDRRWNMDPLRAHLETWLPDAEAVRMHAARVQLPRLLAHWMESVVEGMAVAARRDPEHVPETQAALERILLRVAPHDVDASGRWLERVAAPDGPMEALHAAARWAHWGGAVRTLAEGQIRAAGRAWRVAVRDALDDASARALMVPNPGGA